MASVGISDLPSFMTITSGVQVILQKLPEQCDTLQCWYYRGEEFMKYVVEMGSGGMIYIPSFMMIGSGIQVLLSLLPQQFEGLPC
jgi:hypothetical protein